MLYDYYHKKMHALISISPFWTGGRIVWYNSQDGCPLTTPYV